MGGSEVARTGPEGTLGHGFSVCDSKPRECLNLHLGKITSAAV